MNFLFFKEASARSLGIFRFIFFGLFFVIFWRENGWSRELFLFDNSFFNKEIPFNFLPEVWFSRSLVEYSYRGVIFFSALSCLGLFYRVSSAITAICVLHYFSIHAATGGIRFVWDYATSMPVVWIIVMAFARAEEGFSLDSAIRGKGSGRTSISIEYGWPIQLLRILFVFPFFFSFFNRMIAREWGWMWGDSLIRYIQHRLHFKCIGDNSSAGCLFANLLLGYPRLLHISYFFSQLIEFATVFMPFSSTARKLIVPALIILQVMIFVILLENFRWFIPLYFVWLPLLKGEFVKTREFLAREANTA